jgi:hypothetical protein
MEKIKIAFPYKTSNIFMSGKHYDNTYYHFFVTALKRNQNIDVTYFPVEKSFDTSILKNKFNIILLWSNADYGSPDELLGIEKLNIPVIARAGDPSDAKNAIKNHEKFKIDYYFHFWSEPFFRSYYPKHFKFKTIIFGLEQSLYQKIGPFQPRIKNKILNSGGVGNTKIISRIINQIRNPEFNSLNVYRLRTKCNDLSYVDYTSTLKHKFVNDKYLELLQKYRTAIACSTLTFVVKMLEIPASGCVSFLEVTEKNKCEYVGFEDKKTAVFINENNYRDKFEEFMSNPDDPKWEKIANAGREFVMKKMNNDKAVESLVDLMRKAIDKS